MKNRGFRIAYVLVVFFAFAVLMSSCSTPQTVPPPKVEVPAAKPPAEERPYEFVDYQYPLAAVCNPKLYVYKGARKLLLVNDKILVRDYKIGLGFSPDGDKFVQGDGRTPEGEYSICLKNPAGKYYKSLGVSYPSARHAQSALEMGVITHDQYARIVEANNSLRMPPHNTWLGGAILIHGGGSDRDWTLGCIALNNSDMDELFQAVGVGTTVVIKP